MRWHGIRSPGRTFSLIWHLQLQCNNQSLTSFYLHTPFGGPVSFVCTLQYPQAFLHGAIAFLPLFWTPIVILSLFSSTLCFYPCFSKTKVQFTPTPWITGNGVKKVERWRVCPSKYYVFAPISNPNCDFTSTFFHFVFLPLLFQNEGSVYPNS